MIISMFSYLKYIKVKKKNDTSLQAWKYSLDSILCKIDLKERMHPYLYSTFKMEKKV